MIMTSSFVGGILLFVLLVMSNVSLAIPTIYSNVRVIINDDLHLSIPGLESEGWAQAYLDEVTDVTSVQFENAMPGYGCFFTSDFDNDPFVSETFFAPGTDSYDAPNFEPYYFQGEFLNAELITCFQPPDPNESDDMIYVMLDMTTPSIKSSSSSSDPDSEERRDLRFEILRLDTNPSPFQPLPRSSAVVFDDYLATVHRAAVVHAPQTPSHCFFASWKAPFEGFDRHNRLMKAATEKFAVVCEETALELAEDSGNLQGKK